MVFNDFRQIIDKVKTAEPKRIAVAGAHDAHSVEAALEAYRQKIAAPVFVGHESVINGILSQLGESGAGFTIVDSGDSSPGLKAVECVRDGTADFLMKGAIESKELLKPLVDKNNNLSTGRVMSGFALCEMPSYHKLIVNTDGGMNIAPDLETKKAILLNAVATMRAIGYEKPKVAVLCALETVNPKMPETVDAAELKRLNQAGEIEDCVVEGPISYDLAMSEQAAKEKGFDCPWCGDFDILLSPCLAAGNMLTKVWSINAGGRWAGLIVGAKVPVVLTSRSSSSEEKFLSIALASLVAGGMTGK
ncbi:MAG: phosphate butyryltransferase [Synergistaceae bacterium]|nr:phosphate butyryltransferase [Synergistaceae bacterium]